MSKKQKNMSFSALYVEKIGRHNRFFSKINQLIASWEAIEKEINKVYKNGLCCLSYPTFVSGPWPGYIFILSPSGNTFSLILEIKVS